MLAVNFLEGRMKLRAALLLAAATLFPSMAVAQTQSFATSAGKVEITPIYHATARITAGADTNGRKG